MAGYMDLIEKAKTFSDFKKMSPDTDITALGFKDLKKRGRKAVEKSLEESAKSISDKDGEEYFLRRNDGGMAMSGRGKPVRTF